MNQKTGMTQTLTQLSAARKPSAGPDGPAEEQRHRDRAHRDEVHELGEEEDREPDARVLGEEPADELLLGLDEVERRVVGLGDRGDHEDDERDDRRQPVPVAVEDRVERRAQPCWSTMPRVESVFGLHEHADDREPERGLVAEQLRRRAHRAEQRVLRARRPAREHHAVEADARHRQQPQDAEREVGELQVGLCARRSSTSAADRHDREREERGHDREVRREAEDRRSAGVGARLLLEEQLDAVGERLEQAERARRGRARCGSACRR